jgi:hypothetical protein
MTYPESYYHSLKWASVPSATLFSTSAFANGVGFHIGTHFFAMAVSAGALIGVLGAAFNVKASRLFLFSFLVAVLPLALSFMAKLGIYDLVAAVTLGASFMAGLAFVYSFIRMALHLFSGPRQ